MKTDVPKKQWKEWIDLLRSQVPSGILITEDYGTIIGYNSEILTMWDFPNTTDLNLRGKKITDVINVLEPFDSYISQLKSTGSIELPAYPYISLSHKRKWASIHGWVLDEKDGYTILGWVWNDVTSICEKSDSDFVEGLITILNTIFQNIPLLYFLWEIHPDGTTKILGMNKIAEETLHFSSGEMVGKDFLQFAIPEPWLNPMKKYVQEMFREPKPYLGNHPVFTKEREEIYVRWLDIPVEFKHLNRMWVVSIGEDIRERQKAERALRESKERYQKMVEAVSDYTYHVIIENGQVVQTIHSPTCVAVTGYTPEEFQANPFLWVQMVPEEDRELVIDFAQALRRGEDRGPITHRIIHKDGQIRWVRDTCVLIRDKEGNVVGYDGLIRDVTEEVLAQEAMRKSEERYRNMIEKLGEGYFEIDTEARIRFVNPTAKRILRIPEEKEVSNLLLDFVHCEDRIKVLDSIQNAKNINSKVPSGEICEWKLNSTEEVYIQSSFYPILTQSGKVVGFSGVIRDITEKRKQEQRIWQIQKWQSLGMLVGGIAHDFNNLLMIIQGHLDLIRMDNTYAQFSPEIVSHHREIQHSVDRAAELCRQMMMYAGKGISPIKTFNDLNKIITDLRSILEAIIPRRITLSIELCSSPCIFMCDPVQIRQIVLSVITNSIEAIGESGGVISVRTDKVYLTRDALKEYLTQDIYVKEGQYIQLTITDTGCGIDPSIIDKIFDPFFSTKFLGRGLGLSSVLGIVHHHGGGMKVESEVGKGTRVFIIFPEPEKINISNIVKNEALGSSTQNATTRTKPKVLIIEGDKNLMNLLNAIVRTRGLDIIACSSVQEGIKAIQEEIFHIDLVLIDLNFGLTDNERSLFTELEKAQHHIPIIILSNQLEAYPELEHNRRIVAHISKPCMASDLIQAIDKAFRCRGKGPK